MSKNNVLIISTLGTLFLIIFLFAENIGLCTFINSSCTATFDPIAENLLPIIPLFLFSLITYKMHDTVYRTWIHFSYVWIPLTMIAVFFAPEYSTDWMFPISKSTVAFFSSFLFVIISTFIVLFMWAKLRDMKLKELKSK